VFWERTYAKIAQNSSKPPKIAERHTVERLEPPGQLWCVPGSEHYLNSVSAFPRPGNAYLLDIEGLFTHESRPGRTVGESVGEISKWTVLIGRTGFDAICSIPDPTLSLKSPLV